MSIRTLTRIILAAVLVGLTYAHAGQFDLPNFLPEGDFSVGLEPEIVTSNPAGVGMNLKPRVGTNRFLNWEGIIGTGSGDRRFRLGITADFDWFPDVDGQFGVATPFTVLYQREGDDSNLIYYYFHPMVYKSFKGKYSTYTPFVAVPFGWRLNDNRNSAFSQLALGCMFSPIQNAPFKFSIEAGFEINKSWSYLSGGVTWTPGGGSKKEEAKTEDGGA